MRSNFTAIKLPVNIGPITNWFYSSAVGAIYFITEDFKLHYMAIRPTNVEESTVGRIETIEITLETEEKPEKLSVDHMIYNPATFCLVISCNNSVYCAILSSIADINTASVINFVRIGIPYKRRKIKSLQFHPYNPQLLVILFHHSVIEVYDLASNIEDSFLYLNYGHYQGAEIDKITFVVCNENLIKDFTQLPMFFIMSDGRIYCSGAFLYPRTYLQNEILDELEEITDLYEVENDKLFCPVNELKNKLEAIVSNQTNINIDSLMEFNFNNSKLLIELKQDNMPSVNGIYEFFMFKNNDESTFIFTIMTNEGKSNINQRVLDVKLFLCPFSIVPVSGSNYGLYLIYATSIVLEKSSMVEVKRKGFLLRLLSSKKVFSFNLSFLLDFNLRTNPLNFRDSLNDEVKKNIGCFRIKPNSIIKGFNIINNDRIIILSEKELFILRTPKFDIQDSDIEEVSKSSVEQRSGDSCNMPKLCDVSINTKQLSEKTEQLFLLLKKIELQAESVLKNKENNIEAINSLANDLDKLLKLSSTYKHSLKEVNDKYVSTTLDITKFIEYLASMKRSIDAMQNTNAKKLADVKAKDSEITQRMENIFKKLLFIKDTNEKSGAYELKMQELLSDEQKIKTELENAIDEVI